MNKVLLIAVAVAASAGIVYLIRKKYAQVSDTNQIHDIQRHNRHHLTNAFANAKKHAVKQ